MNGSSQNVPTVNVKPFKKQENLTPETDVRRLEMYYIVKLRNKQIPPGEEPV